MLLGSPIWLWAFLSLIPLIILYLRKPKPLDKVFPSLMFLFKEGGSIKKYSFFRNLIRNLLFLLQLLALVTLAFSLTYPYLSYKGAVIGQHNIIVIDASASSQTKTSEGMTRFEKEIKEARNYIGGRTSIILAGTTAQILLENGKKSDALDILNSIKPTDTSTNLESAMRSAESILGESKGKIVVISDFKVTSGQDPFVLKRILNSKDISVDFIDVSDFARNIGIINMEVNKYQTKVYVKNFNEREEQVAAKLVQGSVVDEESKTINPNSVEVFAFSTLPGVSRVELDTKDDFEIDNTVFVSSPEKIKINTMLVTNKEYEESTQNYLKNALEASPEVDLKIAEPPIIPSLEGYDVVILGGVFSDRILPSFFRDLNTVVKNGTDFIATAHENLGDINFRGLLPVRVTGLSNEPGDVRLKIVNQFTKETDFSSIKVDKYLKTEADNTTAVIAIVNQSPLIALQEIGQGKIIFYGIIDKSSDFKLSPDYPIFWNNLLNYLAGLESVETYNVKIEDKPLLIKTGLYEENNKKIAVNLLDEKESDVSRKALLSTKDEEALSEMGQEENRINFILPLAVLASLIILVELIYVKTRGDL